MDTAKARRLLNAYHQVLVKLRMMEHETDLKNAAHQEARRKLIEALGRLELAVDGLPGLRKAPPFGRPEAPYQSPPAPAPRSLASAARQTIEPPIP